MTYRKAPLADDTHWLEVQKLLSKPTRRWCDYQRFRLALAGLSDRQARHLLDTLAYLISIFWAGEQPDPRELEALFGSKWHELS